VETAISIVALDDIVAFTFVDVVVNCNVFDFNIILQIKLTNWGNIIYYRFTSIFVQFFFVIVEFKNQSSIKVKISDRVCQKGRQNIIMSFKNYIGHIST
jgi:hypothetical protein